MIPKTATAIDHKLVRTMVRAKLLGEATHETEAGVDVHIYLRDGKFIARGFQDGKAFGQTLGADEKTARSRLCELLNQLNSGGYVRPSESRKRPINRNRVPRLTLRQLIDDYLADKRTARGSQTASTYRSRLAPVLDFVERPASRRRWPLAGDADPEFAKDLKAYLHACTTTRNGRANGSPKPYTTRQITNILESTRGLFHWARGAAIRKLPVEWCNPITKDLFDVAGGKDPLRPEALPLGDRIKLIRAMDRWSLPHLAPLLILPLRPGEWTGLLVSDVDFDQRRLKVGSRLGGDDATKGKTSFTLPFPIEFVPLLRACAGERREGPLLRSRRVAENRRRVMLIDDRSELERAYFETLGRMPEGTVRAQLDRKTVFRKVLNRLGGISEDGLRKEFLAVVKKAGLFNGVKLYDTRHAVTTAMHRAGVPHLELRYLTGHSTSDILNIYTGLDIEPAMARYFDAIRPLLDAIHERTGELRFTGMAERGMP